MATEKNRKEESRREGNKQTFLCIRNYIILLPVAVCHLLMEKYRDWSKKHFLSISGFRRFELWWAVGPTRDRSGPINIFTLISLFNNDEIFDCKFIFFLKIFGKMSSPNATQSRCSKNKQKTQRSLIACQYKNVFLLASQKAKRIEIIC